MPQDAIILNLSDIIIASSLHPSSVSSLTRARPCAAEFAQSGNSIICCVLKGFVHVMDTLSQQVLQTIACPSSSPLRQIRAGYTKCALTHVLLQRDRSLQIIALGNADASEDATQEYVTSFPHCLFVTLWQV